MKVDVTKKAKITIVCGSSGSGKSGWVKKQIKGKKRVVIWDADDEYGSITKLRCTTIPEMTALMRKAGSDKPLCVRLVSQGTDFFNLWSAAVFSFGNCIAVAEETADVTTPSKAPAGWGQLIRRGRKRGIEIFAVTQRPAESDKTAIGNASEIHCGMLNRANDRAYMARELDVTEEAINQLGELEYLHRDHKKKSIVKGKLTF
jgi:hypothetical protein